MLTFSTGSPNGLGAAYFLLQHKRQLGGAKTITKIKIWRSEDEDHEEPNVIFYVGDVTPSGDAREALRNEVGSRALDEGIESEVVQRSADGKSLVREHRIKARL